MEKCPKCGWFHTRECVPMTPPPPVMGEGQTKAHNTPITRTPILISAMRLLARDIQSEDGVANAAIAEAADRLAELDSQIKQAQQGIGEGVCRPHDGPENCPTYHDGCNCTVEVLVHNIERAKKAEAGMAEFGAALIVAKARKCELEAALKLALPILRYHLVEPASREIDRETRRAFDTAAHTLDRN